MTKKLKMMRGFTLVELLIVIALIAILSVAVLATINPIEQSNKARDAKFKNDAAEILNAYERFYAAKSYYPWNRTDANGGIIGNGSTFPLNVAVGLVSTSPNFGIVDENGDASGVLIDTSELKSAFGNKEPFGDAVADEDLIYTYHNGSDSNYVCFVPKARANRSLTTQLKCLIGLGAGSTLAASGTSNCFVQDADASGWVVGIGSSANLMCVPE